MLQDLQTTTSNEIQLTDENLEHSKVLSKLLDMACGRPITEFDALMMDEVLDLIRLAQKYDCAHALQILKLQVGQAVAAPHHSLNRFFYACALDQADLASRFLPEAAAVHNPASGGIPSVEHCVPGCSALALDAMAAERIDQLPRKYFLALLRASRHWPVPAPSAPYNGYGQPNPKPILSFDNLAKEFLSEAIKQDESPVTK